MNEPVKFGGFQAINFGRTLVVLFWLLLLLLGRGGEALGEVICTKYKWEEQEYTFN